MDLLNWPTKGLETLRFNLPPFPVFNHQFATLRQFVKQYCSHYYQSFTELLVYNWLWKQIIVDYLPITDEYLDLSLIPGSKNLNDKV